MDVLVLRASHRLIEDRRSSGNDGMDEIWEGVYHMVPAPTEEHSRLQGRIFWFMTSELELREHGVVRQTRNLRDPEAGETDFRVPDLVWFRKGRENLLGDVWLEGPPDVVFEIRSPGDETYKKLPFYRARGVPEVVVVDRDTKRVELFRAREGLAEYLIVSPDAEGWVRPEGVPLALRTRDEHLDLRSAVEPHAEYRV